MQTTSSIYTRSLTALTENLRTTVKNARRDGITSMSRANIRQVVGTFGVMVPPSAFDRLLDDAIAESPMVKAFIRE